MTQRKTILNKGEKQISGEWTNLEKKPYRKFFRVKTLFYIVLQCQLPDFMHLSKLREMNPTNSEL